MRPFASVVIPLFKHILETTFTTSQHTFSINSNRDYIQPSRSSSLYRIHITELLYKQALSIPNAIPILIPDIT